MISPEEATKIVTKAVYNDHPFVTDSYGIKRFKKDTLIDYLHKSGQLDLNKICVAWQVGEITKENARHVNRCIGYSECGFWDCSENDTTNLIKELGMEVVGQYYGWDEIKRHYEGISPEELIDLIGVQNVIIFNNNTR